MTSQEQQQVDSLENKILALESKIDNLIRQISSHKHTGIDSSSQIHGTQKSSVSTIELFGSPPGSMGEIDAPISIYDGVTKDQRDVRRVVGMTAITLSPYTPGEQIVGSTTVGKDIVKSSINSTTRYDFSKNSATQFNIKHGTNESFYPPHPYSFVDALRTPALEGGPVTITNSVGPIRAKLTDTALSSVKTNDLVGCILNLMDVSGNFVESHVCYSNAGSEITITGDWDSSVLGQYMYNVFSPVFLGSATFPWKRIYVGNAVADTTAIRFGWGPSGGSTVATLGYGAAFPNFVVTANPGSIYLCTSGGANATLWVKESGVQTNLGWIQK
jgi:hypothetical protein